MSSFDEYSMVYNMKILVKYDVVPEILLFINETNQNGDIDDNNGHIMNE